MDYAHFVVTGFVLLSVYGLLLTAMVLIMKIKEGDLRSAGRTHELQVLLRKKTPKYILSLGFL